MRIKILSATLGVVMIAAGGFFALALQRNTGTTGEIEKGTPHVEGEQAKPDIVESPTFPRASTTQMLLATMHRTFTEDFNTLSYYRDAGGNVTCGADGTGIWQTVFAFCSRTIFSNAEQQVYTDPVFLKYLNSQSAVPTSATSPFSINNGVLTIETKPADAVIQKNVGAWAKYTSGLLTTQFSFSQKYGYFEMRAKMPKGRGVWPAFWLLPTDKTWPPEIDGVESFGDTSSEGQGGRTKIHNATHYHHPQTGKPATCGAWFDTKVDITEGFHTYGVDVEPTGVTYYFDGVAYGSCPPNKEFDRPLYILINVAVGSEGSWPKSPDTSTPWPAYMQVDYIRAFQKN